MCYGEKYSLFDCRTLLYPVSFLKELTEFRRKRFGINEPGDDPFSLQSGHSLSSDSSRAVRTPKEKSKRHPNLMSTHKLQRNVLHTLITE